MVPADQPCERRSGWCRDSRRLLCRQAPALKFKAHALLASAHCPAVIGAEGGSHQPREAAQQRFLRANPPVVERFDVKSPSARNDMPPAPSLRIVVNRQRSVYGSQPLVQRSTALPTPCASPSSTTCTSRYTEGHQRGSSVASRRTSATSSGVARRCQRLMKWYSLLIPTGMAGAGAVVVAAKLPAARIPCSGIDPTIR
jgi:hypothetical protein